MENMKEDILESWIMSMPRKYTDYLDSRTNLADYFVSIHEYYRRQEKEFAVFHFQSPELEYRGELVRWLKALQHELSFSTLALHLAVHLLDYFMDNHMVAVDKLSRVALVCMLMAVSIEDLDGILPRLQSLCLRVGHEFHRTDIIDVQRTVLTFFGFALGRPTVAHFAHMYLAFVIDTRDLEALRSTGCNKSTGATCVEMYDQARSLLRATPDTCLSEVQYMKFEHSLVAAVFILAVRKSLDLSPAWTKMLQFMTGYSLEDLHPCITLYNTLQNPAAQLSASDFDLSVSEDSGYTTSSSCYSPQSKQSTSL